MCCVDDSRFCVFFSYVYVSFKPLLMATPLSICTSKKKRPLILAKEKKNKTWTIRRKNNGYGFLGITRCNTGTLWGTWHLWYPSYTVEYSPYYLLFDSLKETRRSIQWKKRCIPSCMRPSGSCTTIDHVYWGTKWTMLKNDVLVNFV